MDFNPIRSADHIDSAFPSPFEQIFESLPLIYLLLSPDLYILNASNKYLEATLTQRDKIVGKYVFEVLPDNPLTPEANAVSNFRASLQQVLATRKPHQMARQQYDVPHPTQAGEFVPRYWLPTHTPILDNKGEVRYIVQYLTDETENVQVEARLKESQEKERIALAEAEQQRARLEKFLLEIPAGICIFAGPDFVYDFVNPRYQQQLFPGRDILGKPLFEAVPEVGGQPIAQVLREVYQTGETLEGKEMLIPLAHDDGGPLTDHYFNYIQQARYNEKGEIDGIMTFAYDITELVLARKALEQRERTLQAVNKELAATNQELRTANEQLMQTQEALQQLNNELEEKVAARTQEVKLAQAEAERQWARLEALFMQAPAPIVILDGPQLVYELVNPAYQQIFSGRELLRKPLLEALPEIKGTAIHTIIEGVYVTGETFVAQEMPLQLARREGGPLEEIYWTFTYQARRDEHDKVDGILVFAHEVSGQVLARQKIEDNEKQLRTLLENTPDVITRWDQNLRLLFSNTAFSDKTGLENSLLLGKTNLKIGQPPALALPWMESIVEVIRSGKPKEHYNEYPTPGGTAFYHSRLVPEFAPDGSVQSILAIARDITELKQAEAALQQTAQELAARNEELMSANLQLTRTNIDLDNFIYSTSHDLKTPILNIEGLLGVLQEFLSPMNLASEDIQQVLGMMQGSIERFKQTIADLTEITKLQQESNEVSLVNLSDVIQEVALDLQPQIQETGAKLSIDVSTCPAIPFTVKNLRSIVYNVLSNAIKYHSPEREPAIKIHCREEAAYWVLTVQDNGLGMNLTEDSKLFSMFRRLHDHVEGSGIGLYMVKRILENAQGKIEVESQVGKGSTFTLYFKRAK